MDHNECEFGIGRRAFIRSAAIWGTGAGVSTIMGCSESPNEPMAIPSQDLVSGRRWLRIDSFDTSTGVFRSAECFYDDDGASFTSDIPLIGYEIQPTGGIVPFSRTVDSVGANALDLVETGSDFFQMEHNAVTQPPGAPYEIHISDRTIPGTEIVVLTGYLVDPDTGNRVTFTVTYDEPDIVGAEFARLRPIVKPIWQWIKKWWPVIVCELYDEWHDYWHDQGGGG